MLSAVQRVTGLSEMPAARRRLVIEVTLVVAEVWNMDSVSDKVKDSFVAMIMTSNKAQV